METKLKAYFTVIFFILSLYNILYAEKSYMPYQNSVSEQTLSYATLDKNNIRSWVWSDGVFNQNTYHTRGLEWPKGTGKYAVTTSGFNIAAYVNGQLRLATAYYEGEYSLGYCIGGFFYTNPNFKIYKVSSGDNISNPDRANWGLMVPYGAPYKDVNSNGIYEPTIDIPGVKDAAQTIFLCMTDADSSSHQNDFPIYGKTLPLGAEVHLTAWVYDHPGLSDLQFFKWVVINKNNSAWDSTLFSVASETDLGDETDDFIGYDPERNLAFCYNADNDDGNQSWSYGLNPPAYGMQLMNCGNRPLDIKSFCYFIPCNCGTMCEMYPDNSAQTYNFLSGVKKDRTPWVIPNTVPPVTTKFVYSGNPEAGTGWNYDDGRVNNCGGSLIGNLVLPGAISDTRFILTTVPAGGRMNPGDTSSIQIAQFMARGNSNLNSLTQLNRVSDIVSILCREGFTIGIEPISTDVPEKFTLYQNYPNPFNPVTKIKFDIPESGLTSIKIFDAAGKEVSTLMNADLKAGIYSVDWNGTNYPSGVYFCRLQNSSISKTIKMLMIK